MFNQDGTVRGEQQHKERTCWHCNKLGHTKRNCLDLKDKEKDGVNDSQVSDSGIHNAIEAISPEYMDELRGGQDNIDQAARSTADPPFESGAIWQGNDVFEPEAEDTTAALMITSAEEDELAREIRMSTSHGAWQAGPPNKASQPTAPRNQKF